MRAVPQLLKMTDDMTLDDVTPRLGLPSVARHYRRDHFSTARCMARLVGQAPQLSFPDFLKR